MTPIVILSPHFDDAVLSCWHVLESPADVEVLNVFGGAPPAGSPPGWWDAKLGPPDVAVRTRSEEDRRALAHARRSARDLDFLDAQYRSTEQLHEPIAAAVEASLPDAATLYAPAGLGDQLDHEVVRAAALTLRGLGREVVLYADVPHANQNGWPRSVAGDRGQRAVDDAWAAALAAAGVASEPAVTRLSSEALARKLAAIREYRSQVSGLEAMFPRAFAEPELFGYEVEWRLPAALSSPSAPARKRAAS